MNWNKLKDKFPKSYDEIREYSETNKREGRIMFHEFHNTKGCKQNVTFIHNSNKQESSNKPTS